MTAQAYLHPLLRELEAAGDSQRPAALADFWAELSRRGTPLIESDGDGWAQVTFVWRGDPAPRDVALIQDWGADGIREHYLANLPGTDVWHLARRLPADTRTTYQFSPGYGAEPAALADYSTDPLNPRTRDAYRDEEGWAITFSLLELPEAPPEPWRAWDRPAGAVSEHRLPGDRRAWVYAPDRSDLADLPLLLVFDGRLYKDLMLLPRMLDWLIGTGAVPPLVAVMLDTPQRGELSCQPAFADEMARSVVPWARQRHPIAAGPAAVTAAGASSGGVAAAYCALRYPEVFGNVLSQTGWFRWRPEGDDEFEWLAREFAGAPLLPLRWWLDVGALEQARMLDYGPTQLVANRHMRDVLRAKGYDVRYLEYHGGHDYSSLAHPLSLALAAMIGGAA